MQFARTTVSKSHMEWLCRGQVVPTTTHASRCASQAIALGIAEMVKFPVVRLFSPLLSHVLGKDLQHWADTIIDTTINFIAIWFAWCALLLPASPFHPEHLAFIMCHNEEGSCK